MLGDIFIDPYGYPWPADQLPEGIPKSDLRELAPWPIVRGKDREYNQRLRFTYRGETTSTPEALRGLVIPQMDEPRGTLDRPNPSVFFPPTSEIASALEGLGTLGDLGSWLSKKIFGSRNDNAQAFFNERNAVKVGLAIGGPVGGIIAAKAIESPHEESPAARVDPEKVALALEVKDAPKPEVVAKDFILNAIETGAFKQGMSIEAYMTDPSFSAEAMKKALKGIDQYKKELIVELEKNQKEQDILTNELAQVLSNGRVAPVKGAMPHREIEKLQAQATVEVMRTEQIPINKDKIGRAHV